MRSHLGCGGAKTCALAVLDLRVVQFDGQWEVYWPLPH